MRKVFVSVLAVISDAGGRTLRAGCV